VTEDPHERQPDRLATVVSIPVPAISSGVSCPGSPWAGERSTVTGNPDYLRN
jgi:hypothetical protein